MKNAPAFFTRLMYRNFRTWLQKWIKHLETTVVSYMDDFCIASKKTATGKKGHRLCTAKFLALCQKHSYFLRLAKCQWETERVEFLGVILENGKMKIDPAKREGISKWPRVLTDKSDVQRTMGMLQYQRQFVPHFSHLARPIFATLKKGQAFEWTKEATHALDQIIKAIEANPELSHPKPDQPFELEIDASNYATGAVLIQRDKEGKRVEVGYHSQALNESKQNYDVYDREFLALIRALKFWRHLLEGSASPILIHTDHANLTKHREAQKLSGKIA
jgi:hypothetical protein